MYTKASWGRHVSRTIPAIIVSDHSDNDNDEADDDNDAADEDDGGNGDVVGSRSLEADGTSVGGPVDPLYTQIGSYTAAESSGVTPVSKGGETLAYDSV